MYTVGWLWKFELSRLNVPEILKDEFSMSHCQGLSGDVGGLMVDLVRKYFD
jgi:hypothetical protein